MKIYNVGLLGFGFIGKVHAYGYENLRYYYQDYGFRVNLFGVCTGRQETADKAKQNFNFVYGTTDYRELINHPEIDIIDISSPNNLHKEQLLEVIKAGKHVYCEKPLVTNMEEADVIKDALKNYKGVHQMAFHNRFFPASIKAKSLIDNGSLGDIVSFRVAYYHSGSVDPEKTMGWKQEKGAGVLLDLGSHVIDLAYFFAGEYREVSGISKILYPERIDRTGKKVKVEVEDLFIINAKMKNGAVGIIEASKIATGTEDELKYEIYGTKGALKYNSMYPNYLQFFNSAEKESGFRKLPTASSYPESNFPTAKSAVGWTRAHVHSIYNLIRCVHENRQAFPSLHDGIYNMKVCEAARISAQKKQFLSIS
jgi:predicted dehydrogenase